MKEPDVEQLIETALGRPPKYKADFHPHEFIRLSKDGETFLDIAAIFGLGKTRMYEWSNKYPEFRSAVLLGREIALVWWHKKGRDAINADHFNYPVWQWHLTRMFNQRLPEYFDKSDFSERCSIIEKSLREEKISFEYAKNWIELIEKTACVAEKTELKKILERLEANEATKKEK